MKRLVQFSAGFNAGDAISNQMLVFNNYCKKNQIQAEIYSENISPLAKQFAKRYKTYIPKKGDVILYHHSIHSSVLEFLLETCNFVPKILMYHNVTPHHFFEPYDLKFTFYLKKGRQELQVMKDIFLLNLADSSYNAQELIDLGFSNVVVFPITIDFSNYQKFPRQNHEKNILFVGRIAPNKAQQDLIKLVKIYSEYFDKNIKLKLVGNTSLELQNYKKELEALVQYLYLENQVEFLNFLDQDSLCRQYSQADVFVCMSEHEGFCVPLLESMFYQVPILAYDAGAVKETLESGGILMKKKDFLVMAYLTHRLIYDLNLRTKILNFQNQVLGKYLERNYEKEFLSLLFSLKLE